MKGKASTYLYIYMGPTGTITRQDLVYNTYTDRFLTLPLNLNYYYIQDSDWFGNDLTSVVWPV